MSSLLAVKLITNTNLIIKIICALLASKFPHRFQSCWMAFDLFFELRVDSRFVILKVEIEHCGKDTLIRRGVIGAPRKVYYALYVTDGHIYFPLNSLPILWCRLNT